VWAQYFIASANGFPDPILKLCTTRDSVSEDRVIRALSQNLEANMNSIVIGMISGQLIIAFITPIAVVVDDRETWPDTRPWMRVIVNNKLFSSAHFGL